MIQSLSTPVGMKLKLIPIFQHMHHDATVTRKVHTCIVNPGIKKYTGYPDITTLYIIDDANRL